MVKYILLTLVLCWPILSSAQDSINPYNIALHDSIILQNTDAYYTPFAPPVATDTREQLCCIASELRDPNGVTDYFTYAPVTNGSFLASLYGDTAHWMRLFQAARKSDGTTTDIIVGSHVTNDTAKTHGYGEVHIDSLEDVDFRASGGIRMEAGFHVKPGAYFHAYIEPRWKTTDSCSVAGDSGKSLLFCDEFDHTSLTKWAPLDSVNDYGATFKLSNLQPNITDAGANDGKALVVTLRMDTSVGADYSFPLVHTTDPCDGSVPGCVAYLQRKPGTCSIIGLQNNPLSTGQMWSCPWPFKSADTPWVPISQNLPYGLYEVRDSLPRGMYHSNTYASDNWEDWNLGEMEYTDSTKILPGLSHAVWYGPFRGKFGPSIHGPNGFRSSAAHFTLTNFPNRLIINQFPYAVGDLFYDSIGPGVFDTNINFGNNTYLKGGIPSELLTADSVTFYYERSEFNTTDKFPWSVDPTGTYLSSVYALDQHGDSLRFTKSYQPYKISLFPGVDTFSCHWDHTTGKLVLNPLLDSTFPHSGTSFFYYWCAEGCAYPQPKVQMVPD